MRTEVLIDPPAYDYDEEMHTIRITLDNGATMLLYVFDSPVDGIPVIQLDTEKNAGPVRLSIDDCTVWEGPTA